MTWQHGYHHLPLQSALRQVSHPPLTQPPLTVDSCVRTIELALSALEPAPVSVDVSIVYQSVSLRHPPALSRARIHAALDDAGFDLLNESTPPTQRPKHVQQCSLCQRSLDALLRPSSLSSESTVPIPHKITLSVGGMSCSSCVATITDMLSRLPGVSDVVVSLLTNSATLHLENMFLLSSVTDTIDDCGFQVELISADPIQPPPPAAGPRTISLRVDGMFCPYVRLVSARVLSPIPIRHCPRKILDALRDLFPRIAITKPFADHTDPIVEILYEPAPPDFTVRTIISRILSVDPAFTVSPYHPPTLEQRTRTMQLHEQSIILNRLFFTLIIAIPAFIIGVVYMSLVPSGNPSKAYLMQPMWNGNASRIQWSMFFLATPVMFYGAAIFHRRSIKELVSTWRKGSSTPIITRFTRFGSMNLLVIVRISPSVLATHPSS